MDNRELQKRLQEEREARRQQRKRQKRFERIVILIVLLVILFASGAVGVTLYYYNNNTAPEETLSSVTVSTAAPTDTAAARETPTEAPTTVPTAEPTAEPISSRGTAQSIPADVRSYMTGKSWHQNGNISLDDLSYLTIPHYDFEGNVTQGHMVVNKAVAEDVLDIFAELFDIQYPIERMQLVDDFGADDYTSIEHNNTSAFNYRESTDGSGRLSKHALGRAIDINPQINPYVDSSGRGSHSNAAEYWSRNYTSWSSGIARRAYIGPEADIYKIFIRHGWEWGGSWSSYRDYQHFQKSN